MTSPWGKIGDWAAEAERAEAEEAAAAAMAAESYPSLKEAVTAKKGKKKTKMTLQEFTMAGTGTGGDRGLTPVEMMQLPTGPKQRTAEEMQFGRIGGGFSSYGGGRSGERSDRSDRRSYGGFDEDRRGSVNRNTDFDQPSRADEVDNWARTKKTPSYESGLRSNRYNSLGGSPSAGGTFSRADEIDNWTVNKKPVAPAPARSSFGSGFRDFSGPVGPVGPETERWSRGTNLNQGRATEPTERRRLVLDPPNREGVTIRASNDNKPNPFGNARPREEILAEKGLDWRKVDLEVEAKVISSRPTSSHSNSRPESAHSGSSVEVSAPRAKVNPFGDAKPREVLLQEKGVDYRKIDLELERRRLGRPETEEEKSLKEEIHNLKTHLEKESVENQPDLQNTLLEKEKELEQLSRDLDDKLRFSQKTIERPGSGAGRVGSGFQERPGSGSGRAGVGFQERPPSRSGSIDESRSVDFSERPRSRGDFGMRRGDDRRGFGGGSDNRGFLGNRDIGRSSSMDRW